LRSGEETIVATRIAKASRRAGPASGDLDVILDVLFEDGMLFLSVRNIGGRPALNVAVSFDEPISALGGATDVAALPLFRNIEFLAPGREIRTLLDSSASYFARRQPEQITARISYRDGQGRRRTGTIRHDLRIYKAIAYLRKTSDT
jgi:hypothetical protein